LLLASAGLYFSLCPINTTAGDKSHQISYYQLLNNSDQTSLFIFYQDTRTTNKHDWGHTPSLTTHMPSSRFQGQRCLLRAQTAKHCGMQTTSSTSRGVFSLPLYFFPSTVSLLLYFTLPLASPFPSALHLYGMPLQGSQTSPVCPPFKSN
jgi:hypothetical protein